MPDTPFFRPALFEFLRQLRRHNDREWFAKNKARYQQVIVEPALLFIGSFASHLVKLSPFFVADPRPTRGSLFRIYRDTRFSPDKRPFRLLRWELHNGRGARAPPICDGKKLRSVARMCESGAMHEPPRGTIWVAHEFSNLG